MQRSGKQTGGGQTKIGFISEAGQFCDCSALKRNGVQRKISGMNESWPCSRLMPLPWPWRSLAAYCWRLGDMRSIAPSRLSPPDSDCGTERNGALTGGRRSAGHAESSGVKRSEPDGVRPAISKAVGGISTKQSGGEMPVSAAQSSHEILALNLHRFTIHQT